jgi:hypothetical protein
MRILLLLFISYTGLAQNIFDPNHTRKYADHLMASGQYELATKELERLHFFAGANDTIKTNLMRAYRLSNHPNLAFQKANVLYPELLQMPILPAFEYAKICFTLEKWDDGSAFWNNSKSFKKEDAAVFEATKYVFTNKLDKAKSILALPTYQTNETWKAYNEVFKSTLTRKKPFAAGFLSALVPGLGRVYTKDWKDGLLSFIFTASMGVQTYRNFNKHGFNNPRGYIYGAIGTGFYLGNIYGSVKSAQNYNLKQLDKTKHEISAIFNANY